MPDDLKFQSTHPVWGATTAHMGRAARTWNFNPRTPCGVRRRSTGHPRPPGRFQSTHLVWGATASTGSTWPAKWISIHAPRVGCDQSRSGCYCPRRYFNPRTPCGVRRSSKSLWLAIVEFQSTHPVWGATVTPEAHRPPGSISIHAPRVGCDAAKPPWRSGADYFNPRTPCGVRQLSPLLNKHLRRFQSTHPVWGATEQ